MLPRITGEFTVGSDPELRFAPSGIAVASFSAVADKSKKTDDGWEKDKEIWVRVTVFKQMAEHVAESITKGMRVVIAGQINLSDWEDKDGNKRTSAEVVADEIGVSLRFGTAKYTKAERSATASKPASDNPWETNAGGDSPPPF